MAQHQRKHYRKKRHFRFTRLYGVLSVLLIVAAIIGGCIVFFRVDQVTVEGNSRYTQAEIVAATGIEEGDNMFLLNKYQAIDAMLAELPYVESVSIRRALPSTIRVTVTECTVAAAVEDADTGTWWLVSSGGKLLERTDDQGDYLTVTGLTLAAPSEGTELAVESELRLQLEALLELLASMESREMLEHAQTIELGASSVTMLYDGRLTVKMKLSADFDYEMRVLNTVMEDYVDAKWSETDTGTLDRTADDDLTHLVKDAAEN